MMAVICCLVRLLPHFSYCIIFTILYYSIFFSIIIKGSVADDGAQEILKKLDESSTKQSLKTVTGGVLIDMENTDMYGK